MLVVFVDLMMVVVMTVIMVMACCDCSNYNAWFAYAS